MKKHLIRLFFINHSKFAAPQYCQAFGITKLQLVAYFKRQTGAWRYRKLKKIPQKFYEIKIIKNYIWLHNTYK